MKKQPFGNTSPYLKALGYVFLFLALLAGVAYLVVAILFQTKNVYPYDYFGLPEIIIIGSAFLLVVLIGLGAIALGGKKTPSMLFLLSSLGSFAFLMLSFFVILTKMKGGSNESSFTTAKFAFGFFILGLCAMVILSSVVPFLFIKRGYFNCLLHIVSYIVEAVLWAVLFVMMITRMSPTLGFLLAAFIFLRTSMYWWQLIAKHELEHHEASK